MGFTILHDYIQKRKWSLVYRTLLVKSSVMVAMGGLLNHAARAGCYHTTAKAVGILKIDLLPAPIDVRSRTVSRRLGELGDLTPYSSGHRIWIIEATFRRVRLETPSPTTSCRQLPCPLSSYYCFFQGHPPDCVLHSVFEPPYSSRRLAFLSILMRSHAPSYPPARARGPLCRRFLAPLGWFGVDASRRSWVPHGGVRSYFRPWTRGECVGVKIRPNFLV